MEKQENIWWGEEKKNREGKSGDGEVVADKRWQFEIKEPLKDPSGPKNVVDTESFSEPSLNIV